MGEINSKIYFRHDNTEIMSLLDSLLHEANGGLDRLKSCCVKLNSEKGIVLLESLLRTAGDPEIDLSTESLKKEAGYSICHFVHGTGGDEIIGEIVAFLYRLCPEVHAQAWGYGDEDPWEFWFKFEGGLLQRKDDEPTDVPQLTSMQQ